MSDDNGELKIESGIPVPPARARGGMNAAIRLLKPGESVLCHKGTEGSVRNAAYFILGAGNFVCRKEPSGIRVWRIK